MNVALLVSKADFSLERVIDQNPNDKHQRLSIVDCMLKIESGRNHATGCSLLVEITETSSLSRQPQPLINGRKCNHYTLYPLSRTNLPIFQSDLGRL